MSRTRPLALCLALAALATAAAPTSAHARKPEDVLKGRLILSTKPFPIRFRSDATFVKHMRKVHRTQFRFNDARKISIEFMAFFARPVNTTQLTMNLYDITRGNPRLVNSFPVYLRKRGQRILASYMELVEGDDFVEGNKYMATLSVGYRGRVLAEENFQIKPGKAAKGRHGGRP